MPSSRSSGRLAKGLPGAQDSGAPWRSSPRAVGSSRELEANQTAINDEDALATEQVQRGVRSRHAVPGPLGSVEAVVAHFQRYLARRLLPSG